MMRVTIECFSRSRVESEANNPSAGTFNSSLGSFRRRFELGEIVAVGLDQVAHALDRVGLEAGALVAVGHLRGRQRLAAAGLGIGGVEPLQRMRHPGAQFGEVAQLLLGNVDLAEQRIGEDLVQLGEEAVLVGGGEIAQIEVVGFREAEQDLRRHRALVALYQVDIARRNPEAFRDLGLRQARVAGGCGGIWGRQTAFCKRHQPWQPR